MYCVEDALPGSEFNPAERATATRYTMAYDHHHYEVFDRNNLSLTVSKKTPDVAYGANLPLMFPYRGILIDLPNRTLDSLRGKDVWNKWVARVKSISAKKMDGHDCVEVDAPDEHGVALVRTCFAKDLDYYPIFHETLMPSGIVVEELNVTSVKEVQTDDGQVSLPLTPREVWRAESNGKDTMHFNYDIRKVKVNGPIDYAVFTLSRGMAESYENYDIAKEDVLPSAQDRFKEQKSIKAAEGATAATRPGPPPLPEAAEFPASDHWRRIMYFILPIFAIVAASVAFIALRLRPRRIK